MASQEAEGEGVEMQPQTPKAYSSDSDAPDPPPREDLEEPPKAYFGFAPKNLFRQFTVDMDGGEEEEEEEDADITIGKGRARYNAFKRYQKCCGRIGETLLHAFGFYLLLIYMFALWRSEAFFFNDLVKDMVVREEFEGDDTHIYKGFMDIGATEEFYQWLHGPLINGLFGETLLNLHDGALPPAADNVENYTKPFVYPQGTFYPFGINLLVNGQAQMRQWRAMPNLCRLNKGHKFAFDPPHVCYDGFVFRKEEFTPFYDERPYGPNNQFKFDPEVGSKIMDSEGWLISDAPGRFYPEGGFIQTLRGYSVEEVKTQVDYLAENGWIDYSTVAVSIEFTIFSPSINNFVAAMMIVEFPKTGGAVPWFKIQPLTMFEYTENCWPARPQSTVALSILLILWVVISVFLPNVLYMVRRQYGDKTRGRASVYSSHHYFRVTWSEGGEDVEAVFPFYLRRDVDGGDSGWFKWCTSNEYEDHVEPQAHADLQHLLKKLSRAHRGVGKRNVYCCHQACKISAFKAFDTNHDGYVSAGEFYDVLVFLGMKKSEAKALLVELDVDGDGQLSQKEFNQAFSEDSDAQRVFADAKRLIEETQRESLGLEEGETLMVVDEWRQTCSWTVYYTSVNPATGNFMYQSKNFPYRPLNPKQISEVFIPRKTHSLENCMRMMFGELTAEQVKHCKVELQNFFDTTRTLVSADGSATSNLTKEHIEVFARTIRVDLRGESRKHTTEGKEFDHDRNDRGELKTAVHLKAEEIAREEAKHAKSGMMFGIMKKLHIPTRRQELAAVKEAHQVVREEILARLQAKGVTSNMPTTKELEHIEDDGRELDAYGQARYLANEQLSKIRLGMLYPDSWVIVDLIVLVFSLWVMKQQIDRILIECESLKRISKGSVFVSLFPIVYHQGWQNVSFTVLMIAMTVRTFKFFLYFGKYFPELRFYLQAMVATVIPTLYFLVIFFVVSLGFAAAGHMLFKGDIVHYRTLGGAIWMNYRALLGDVDIAAWEENDRFNARVFFLVYASVSAIFFFNLVVGILSEAFAQKSEELQERRREEILKAVKLRQSKSLAAEDKTEKLWVQRAKRVLEAIDDFSRALSEGTHEGPVSVLTFHARAIQKPPETEEDDLLNGVKADNQEIIDKLTRLVDRTRG